MKKKITIIITLFFLILLASLSLFILTGNRADGTVPAEPDSSITEVQETYDNSSGNIELPKVKYQTKH